MLIFPAIKCSHRLLPSFVAAMLVLVRRGISMTLLLGFIINYK